MRRITSLFLALVFTFVCTLSVLASGLTEAQQRKDEIGRDLSSISSQKKSVKSEGKRLENEKESLENQQKQENEEYQQLVEKIDDLNGDIELINAAVQEAEQNYTNQKDLLKTRLRVMYEHSETSLLEILIESKNLTDFFERLELISTISKMDKQLVEELNVAKLDVEYKKQLKVEAREEKQAEAREKEGRLQELKISRASIDDEIRRNREKLNNLERQEDELIKQSDKLVNYIKNLQKNSKYTGGNMVWPYPRYRSVASPFGMRKHPILKKYKMHTGVDIGGRYGDSIVAANSGVVILSGYSSGYGYRIVIDHGGGITTLYAHSSKLLVKEGSKVEAGQTIAKVGSTGLSTGPHLHFEVRKNGVPKNPLDYVSP